MPIKQEKCVFLWKIFPNNKLLFVFCSCFVRVLCKHISCPNLQKKLPLTLAFFKKRWYNDFV